MESGPAVNNKVVFDWFERGDQDHTNLVRLLALEVQPYNEICSLSRQAIEKWLKAYLMYKTGVVASITQDLVILTNECAVFNKRFEEISDQCYELANIFTASTCPEQPRVTARQMWTAVTCVNDMYMFLPLLEVRKTVVRSLTEPSESDDDIA